VTSTDVVCEERRNILIRSIFHALIRFIKFIHKQKMHFMMYFYLYFHQRVSASNPAIFRVMLLM